MAVQRVNRSYNYSIIIPHKNIPDLLLRCLKSIPNRDDVQVIIVDDNSDSSIVDFAKFPGCDRDNTEIYFVKEDRGAGYARNVGIEHAKGKWLVFADSDDFFTPAISELMNKYVNFSDDIIYFQRSVVLSDDISVSSERDPWTDISKYINSDGAVSNEVRWKTLVVWARFFSRRLINENNIRFQEIKWSNDVYFQAKAGALADSIYVSQDIIYVATVRKDSLAYLKSEERSTEELICRIKAGMDMHAFLKCNGYTTNSYIFTYNMCILKSRFKFITIIKLLRYVDNSIQDDVFSVLCNEGSFQSRIIIWICCKIACLKF
ncbi:MAG: glycosyltransferase family 2 protein [Saccharofermentans sp.]|nr:glycosyltransferase family 2 protein [Saccharofermentans sp.]